MRFIFLFCAAMSLTWSACAQQIPVRQPKNGSITEKGDSSYRPPKAPHINHYLGIQANQLLNQLFNFGNTTAAVTNPYLAIYSMNSVRTGWGLNAGLGYNISTSTDDSNPQATRKTTVKNFNHRIGFERKIYITEKWLGSFGFDALYSSVSNNTKVSTQAGFSGNFSETDASTTSFGGGLRGGLSYFIASKIMLGTEVTYYYRSSKTKQTTSNTSQFTDPNTGITQTQTTHDDTKFSTTDLTLRAPISVFLILKL